MPLPDGLSFKVEFDPAWDKRAEDPNNGQHFAQLRFAIAGPRGAVEWTLFTGWTVESAIVGPHMAPAYSPIPAILAVHERVAEDAPDAQPCHLVDHCRGDVSFQSDHVYKALVLGGFDAVQQLLVTAYNKQWTADGPPK